MIMSLYAILLSTAVRELLSQSLSKILIYLSEYQTISTGLLQFAKTIVVLIIQASLNIIKFLVLMISNEVNNGLGFFGHFS